MSRDTSIVDSVIKSITVKAKTGHDRKSDYDDAKETHKYHVFVGDCCGEPLLRLGKNGDIFRDTESQIWLRLLHGWTRYNGKTFGKRQQKHPDNDSYVLVPEDLEWVKLEIIRARRKRDHDKEREAGCVQAETIFTERRSKRPRRNAPAQVSDEQTEVSQTGIGECGGEDMSLMDSSPSFRLLEDRLYSAEQRSEKAETELKEWQIKHKDCLTDRARSPDPNDTRELDERIKQLNAQLTSEKVEKSKMKAKVAVLSNQLADIASETAVSEKRAVDMEHELVQMKQEMQYMSSLLHELISAETLLASIKCRISEHVKHGDKAKLASHFVLVPDTDI